MTNMIELLKEVYPLPMVPVSSGADQCTQIFCRELDFRVYGYASGSEHNGWVVPQNWAPQKAEIRKDGRLIYDGGAHPLGVWGYSISFQGKVSLDELREHLAFSENWDHALIYHGDLYYKQGTKNWGFSVPKSLFNSLVEGEYEVDLQTEFEPGTLKVLDYFLPGRSEETIIFNAHNCHAAQANDDISDCVVGVELMKRLSERNNYYSYRLLICPELFGTVFWLDNQDKEALAKLKYAIMLKSVGNRQELALQKSFWGDTWLDRAAVHYFRFHHPNSRIGAFRTVYGNDEIVFEAPGYEIPSISLTRYPSPASSPGRYPVPFPEYHTSMDTHEIILESKLNETVETVLGILNILEHNYRVHRHFDGLLCLSNPKYDLYMRTWDPAQRTGPRFGENEEWHYLMNCIMRYFDDEMTVLDIAGRHNLYFEDVLAYIHRFSEKGLVSLIQNRSSHASSEHSLSKRSPDRHGLDIGND